jgi:hypothetical protein
MGEERGQQKYGMNDLGPETVEQRFKECDNAVPFECNVKTG